MRISALLAFVALFLLDGSPRPALAQDLECHHSNSFHVIAEPYADQVGMRFHVVPRTGEATPSCVLAKNKGGFTIGEDGDPLWLEALVGDYLVLTRSTGPDGDLVIYDLADPDEAVIDVPAQEMSVGENGVSFWEVTGEADAENCPEWEENTSNGFGSVILEERHFGFGEGELESSGETRCGITQ